MQQFLINQEIIAGMPDETNEDLLRLAAAYRVNCLAGLVAADHGWLGASFSCMEILTYIYHRFIKDPLLPLDERASLHLSKGHAAMALYSVLAGRGCFPVERLLSYKSLGGLPAHCDRTVPGVDSDSGSLGQGLSKAIGVAIANRAADVDVPVFSIVGDGELQEGQLFEAFLSLRKFGVNNCITIVDRNFLQSDSQTNEIKDAHDWSRVFTHIGLNCMSIDGHSIEQIDNAIRQGMRINAPLVIIAETVKGGGTEITAMKHDTPRREGIWHGRIPDDRQYISMVKELVIKTDNPKIVEEFKKYLTAQTRNKKESQAKPAHDDAIATGPAFSSSLLEAADRYQHLYILDADLEKSCRLTEVAKKFPNRFLEVGISEQDMCSIAAGLALTGRVPVVNTYASFYKRSIDQIYACITEKLPVIFAAHYSGADYYTDGKSHQAINDIGLMRSLGEIEIYEPLNAAETKEMLVHVIERMTLEWAEQQKTTPAYFRLHRTPADIPETEHGFLTATPHVFKSSCRNREVNYLFVSGPHMLVQALKAQKTLAKEKVNLEIVAVNHYSDENKIMKKMVEKGHKLFVLEDHRRETGLASFVAGLEFRNPVRIGARNYVQSTLSLDQMLEQHKITADDVCNVVRKVLSCSHNK
ncbi:MAG: transketolase [Clostridiales bacterium]|nr:transketolase [Clostridiales bacterium]MDN5281718.1 transketolase [Candidatus Ozemobacter sp.]